MIMPGFANKVLVPLAAVLLPGATVAAGETPPDTPALVEKGKPQAGVAPCQSCHGADGRSGVPMYPHLAGQYRDYLVQSLKAYRSGARSNPTMNQQAKSLSDAEIQALATYYAEQEPAVRPLSLD
jgi:cytochrome c553